VKRKLREVGARCKREITIYRRLLKDRRTPRMAKLLLALAIAYFVSPIDLIPDCIPVLGQLDDLLIVPALVAMALSLIPGELTQEHRAALGESKNEPRRE
jgi:uncharacterized membrane protein YkvA (DUF1232 family)